jgi:hypothetical protein
VSLCSQLHRVWWVPTASWLPWQGGDNIWFPTEAPHRPAVHPASWQIHNTATFLKVKIPLIYLVPGFKTSGALPPTSLRDEWLRHRSMTNFTIKLLPLNLTTFKKEPLYKETGYLSEILRDLPQFVHYILDDFLSQFIITLQFPIPRYAHWCVDMASINTPIESDKLQQNHSKWRSYQASVCYSTIKLAPKPNTVNLSREMFMEELGPQRPHGSNVVHVSTV